MMCRWLVLRFQAPLMALGGVAIDQVGPTRDFPSTSMLTGLIASALGWHWSDRSNHQLLQERLVFAARRDREGATLEDIQNARLKKTDRGWTTHGKPEERKGASFNAPHRRQREYYADSALRIVVALEPEHDTPTLDEIAAALDRPARPLFLGRKSCLISVPILDPPPTRWVDAPTAHSALLAVPAGECGAIRAQWPEGQGPETGGSVDCIRDIADMRNWLTGLHGGSRRVIEGWVKPAKVE